ncbi:MAG: DUF2924 domain-containing protein [Gemmataceae bacterium]|nr:DUF2924 domain-containing protein [Gemmataceae bacterium]
MDPTIANEIAEIGKKPIRHLRARYAELFGEPTFSGNRLWLVKRIAWRLQAIAEGDLSERARRRAEEIANDADIRLSPPAPKRIPLSGCLSEPEQADGADDRLPPRGAKLVREYKGRKHEVTILAQGFEFGGKVYRSLSAVAKAITGSHCNGFQFFRLNAEVAS